MEKEQPTLLQVFMSVLSSFFGVQKRKNLERDFKHGKPSQYIIVGLVLTAAFVLIVWGVVQLVLSAAGI
jgi:hypothetical protein